MPTSCDSRGSPICTFAGRPRKYTLSTQDFVAAADLLRPQHDLHTAKSDHVTGDPLAEILKDLLTEAVNDALSVATWCGPSTVPGLPSDPAPESHRSRNG